MVTYFVYSNKEAVAMITTGEGKFYCNGIDLAAKAALNEEMQQKLLHQLCKLVAKILTFPIPTVAAINGENSVK